MPKGMYPGLSGEQLERQSKAANELVTLANRMLHSEVLVEGFEHSGGYLKVVYVENTEQGAE